MTATLDRQEKAPAIKTAIVYVAAAFFEIAGCFSFRVWIRDGKSSLWIAPGIVSLMLFAWLLTPIDTAAAGRAYAAYGGVYIVAKCKHHGPSLGPLGQYCMMGNEP